MLLRTKIQKLLERLSDNNEDGVCMSGFSYFAFISYNENDEKWAGWLQWKLEHYRIPTKVRSERNDVPKLIRPVFWYKNDLAGAHLSGSIKKELAQSKYLIVICSRNSAKSQWVSDEVSYFKDELGRADRIIPFVVDGEINATEEEQNCLPLPIRNLSREKELRSIDVREYGKGKALVNIVSTLFDIKFNVLWDRFEFEKRRSFAIFCTVFAFCAAVLLGCWDYFLHTKYEYYVGMEDCNGVPAGIIQVNNSEAKNHYRLYRFEYRKNLLQRVIFVDGDGNPQDQYNTEFLELPCVQELFYDNNDDISRIICKNSNFKTLYVKQIPKDKLSVDLKDEEEDLASNFIFSSTASDQGKAVFESKSFVDRLMMSPSKISRYVYKRDKAGYISKKMFARYNGDDDNIGMDVNGVSGFEYERDSLHRVVRIYFLDDFGRHRINNLGIAGKRYQYDEYGNMTVAEYVDDDGNLKYNDQHWAKSVNVCDRNGYYIQERLYGADGSPCVSVHGYHKMLCSYSKNSETRSYYGINDEPAYILRYGEDPGGYAMTTTTTNENGHPDEVQFKDSDGNLCFNREHVAVIKLEYDSRGYIAKMSNYGIDDKPCSNNNGIHSQCFMCNESGYLVEQSIFNVLGLPVQDNYGIHRICYKYDETGHRISEICTYNVSGMLFHSPLLNGAAKIKLGYKGSSSLVSDIYFYTFDNKPMETNVGARIHCKRNTYDSYGQTLFYYYDTDDELYSDSEHCAILEVNFNKFGQETDRCYYDDEKHPLMLQGIFRVNMSYTKFGQVEKICCYDSLQHLTNCPEGWAVQENRYKNDAVTDRSYYGKHGERIEIVGVHKYVYEVDDCGYILSISAFDKKMQPAVNSQIGAHKISNIYDDNKCQIGSDYYMPYQKEPFVCIRQKKNLRGLPVEEYAYNAKGEPVESRYIYGVAKYQCEYDSQDRPVYMCATDRNGHKMNTVSAGFAEAYFNFENNIREAVFFDSERKLVNNEMVADNGAYFIDYVSDYGQTLFSRGLKVLYDNEIKTLFGAALYDMRGNPQKVIQYSDETVKVYDLVNNTQDTYYSYCDEYEGYLNIIDSIQLDVESKYGHSRLDTLIKNDFIPRVK